MPTLRINGEPRQVPDAPDGAPLTVERLLSHLDRDPRQSGVAVAVGDRVVRRAAWAETAVQEGDRVEIITAAQGG